MDDQSNNAPNANQVDELNAQGLECAAAGEIFAAIHYFLAAIAQNPVHAGANFNLAHCLESLASQHEDFAKQSEEHYKSAQLHGRDDPDITLGCGQHLIAIERSNEAINLWQSFLKRHPDDAIQAALDELQQSVEKAAREKQKREEKQREEKQKPVPEPAPEPEAEFNFASDEKAAINSQYDGILRSLSANIRRTYHVDAEYTFQNTEEFQKFYMPPQSGALYPNTTIWHGDTLRLQINSLGCRGPELPEKANVIACFGDSCTFGIEQTWPEELALGPCLPLNAGVEGINLSQQLTRYHFLRDRVDMAAIVVYPGWHNLIYSKRGPAAWLKLFNAFDGDHVTAICTLPSPLIEECCEKGLQQHLENEGRPTEHGFYFWGNLQPTIEKINEIYEALMKFNDFIRTYCQEKSRVCIDLYSLLKPNSYAEITRDFFDIVHPRPKTQPRIGKYIARCIEPELRKHLKEKGLDWNAKPAEAPGLFDRLKQKISLDKGKSGDKDIFEGPQIYPHF